MSSIQELRRTRGTYKGKLTLFNQYLNETLTGSSLSNLQLCELSNRLQKIKDLYNEFDNIQTNIEISVETEDDMAKEHEERQSFESKYFKAVAAVRGWRFVTSAGLPLRAMMTSRRRVLVLVLLYIQVG